MYTVIDLHYDTYTQALTADNTASTAITWSPDAFYGENIIITAEVRNNAAVTDLDDIINWKLGVGNLSTTSSPLIESNNASFNVPGDWSEVDPTIGKISIRMNTTSTTLNTDLGTKNGKKYYAEIAGVSNTSGDTITIALFPLTILNTIYK